MAAGGDVTDDVTTHRRFPLAAGDDVTRSDWPAPVLAPHWPGGVTSLSQRLVIGRYVIGQWELSDLQILTQEPVLQQGSEEQVATPGLK